MVKWVLGVFIMSFVYIVAFGLGFKFFDWLDRSHNWYDALYPADETNKYKVLAFAIFWGLVFVGLGLALSGLRP